MSQLEKECIISPNIPDKTMDMIITVPNILSFFRILLIIPFVVMFVTDHINIAFVCVVVSGISDALDGIIARGLNQISKLGKMLDPIADKLTLLAIVLCLGMHITEIFGLAVILICKEVCMLVGGVCLVRRKITPPQAKWYGKTATVIFYLTIVSVVLYREIMGYPMEKLTFVLFLITAGAMLFALLNYAHLFFRLLEEKNASEK